MYSLTAAMLKSKYNQKHSAEFSVPDKKPW